MTGTSGKSSVADFARQLFAALGHRSASLGTLGVITSDGAAYGSLTTPDPVALHETLDRLAGDGVTHLAMEASSHGLDQRRLDGVRLKAAGFTNLGRDHLDYHGTIDAYPAAKLRLFDDAAAGRTPPRSSTPTAPWPSCSSKPPPSAACACSPPDRPATSLTLLEARAEGFAQSFAFASICRNAACARRSRPLPLLGAFQVENALLAAGLVLAVGAEGGAGRGACRLRRG